MSGDAPSSGPASPTFAVVELVVADMGATLAFYRALGVAAPPGAEDEPHVELDFNGVRVALDTQATIRSFDPDWTPPTGPGHRVALAFRCDSPAEVDRQFGELVDAGYAASKPPWDAFWGMRYAVVLDPNGVPVDLFCELPGT